MNKNTLCRVLLGRFKHTKLAVKTFAVAGLLQLPTQAFAFVDGTWMKVDEAEITQSDRYNKRRVGYYTFNDITLSNSTPLAAELRLVVTDSSHTVMDADGVDTNDDPYFNVTAVEDSHQIYFETKRGAFSYAVELQQFVMAEPAAEAFEFNYDFDTDQIQKENNNWEGWVYPAQRRGVVTFEQGEGVDGSAAYLYEDTHANVNILQTGIRFNNRTNKDNINPWTDTFAEAQGDTIQKVSMWVKVDKTVPGDVTLQHHLIPYPIVDDKKGPTITAGIAAGPQYSASISAADNGAWVYVELIDSNTNSSEFTIPDSWVHHDGSSPIHVYPDILFGGLEIGDKVYIDNYQVTGILADDGTGGDTGGGTGGDTGGGTGGDTGGGTGGDTGGEILAVAQVEILAAVQVEITTRMLQRLCIILI